MGWSKVQTQVADDEYEVERNGDEFRYRLAELDEGVEGEAEVASDWMPGLPPGRSVGADGAVIAG